MWCLISQPNSVVFEVRCDPKAIGQDCLEKVRFPFIICVTKYCFMYIMYHNLQCKAKG